MANTIKIKRNLTDNLAPTTSEVAKGELAFTEGTKKLYYRMNDDTILEIGGEGAFLKSNESDTMDGDLTITGSLTVQGTTTQVDSTTVEVADAMMKLAKDNSGDAVDAGWYALYNDGADKYAGIARDASDSGKFILYHGLTAEPGTTVDTTDAGFTKSTLKADIEGNLSGNPVITAATVASSFDMNGNELILDADGDTSITSDTDDQIDFKVGGADELSLTGAALYPSTNGGLNVGSAANQFSSAWFSGTVTAATVDINAGNIDGTAIGANTASTGAFTSVSASSQITSTVATGTAPMVIASTTAVTNLNADLLDGQHAPTGTIVGTSDSQTLTNKTITNALIENGLRINDSDDSHVYTLNPGNITANRAISLPALTDDDTFVFANHTQTLDNKTIDCGTY